MTYIILYKKLTSNCHLSKAVNYDCHTKNNPLWRLLDRFIWGNRFVFLVFVFVVSCPFIPTLGAKQADRMEEDGGPNEASSSPSVRFQRKCSYGEVVVIDHGSSTIKSGHADEKWPRKCFPTVTRQGTVLHNGIFYPRLYFGEEATGPVATRDCKLPCWCPVVRGIFTSECDMEAIWHHIFFQQLRIPPEEHPVFLVEPLLNSRANRERMAAVMFRSFEIPALDIGVAPQLALYHERKSTGCVVECGHEVSHAVPIISGYAIPHAVVRLDVSGRDLTVYLAQLLKERGHTFDLTEWGDGWKTVSMIKEQLTYVSPDLDAELQSSAAVDPSSSSSLSTRFTLPDGRDVVVGGERVQCPEALFRPSLIKKGKLQSPLIKDGRSFKIAVGLGLSPEAATARVERIGTIEKSGLLQLDKACLYTIASFLSGHMASQLTQPVTTWAQCPSKCRGGRQVEGLQGCVFHAVMSCDVAIRAEMFENIVLTGGTTMIPGMSARLTKELEAILPLSTKVRVVASLGRQHSVWAGARRAAAISSSMIPKSDFDRFGPSVIHRVCTNRWA
jgi:actin-related protein